MATLLWDETQIFEERYEKSASALVAVAQTLEKHKLFDGGEKEFLGLYEEVLAVDPEIFTKVWLDPSSYFWVRVSYELLGSCLTNVPLPTRAKAYCETVGVLEPKEALGSHLHTFKRFVLAVRFLEGKDCSFATPLRLCLPVSIPGTRLSLDGAGPVEIIGMESGCVKGTFESQSFVIKLETGASILDGKITVLECPMVSHSGCEIYLQPHAFNNLPSLDFVGPTLEVGMAFQFEHQALVKDTLEMLERYHKDIFEQFRDHMVLIGLKPLGLGTYTNISCSELPCAFVATIFNDPLLMADTFIHEFHHNRLFFIEEKEPFFTEAQVDPLGDNIYYSPWRYDHRPLHGVFHAVYVYIPLCAFWLNVCKAGEASEMQLKYAKSQMLRSYFQLHIGLRQLRKYGPFTAFGEEIFQGMKSAVEDFGETLKTENISFDAPAYIGEEDGSFAPQKSKKDKRELTVAEAIEDHIELYSPKEQAREILEEVVWPLIKG